LTNAGERIKKVAHRTKKRRGLISEKEIQRMSLAEEAQQRHADKRKGDEEK
jgi:hypothetical protein